MLNSFPLLSFTGDLMHYKNLLYEVKYLLLVVIQFIKWPSSTLGMKEISQITTSQAHDMHISVELHHQCRIWGSHLITGMY